MAESFIKSSVATDGIACSSVPTTLNLATNKRFGTRLHIPTWYYDLMNHDEARSKG